MQYLRTCQNGDLWKKLNSIYDQHVQKGVDKVFGKYLAAFVPARYKETITRHFATLFQAEFFYNEKLQKDFLRYFDEMTDVERTNSRRMSLMSSADFEMLLHPVFQEDEWILILLGGILGAIVGFAQVSFLGA